VVIYTIMQQCPCTLRILFDSIKVWID